jgi:RNA polymerase sigma-70 factor (ECF subfamily)
MVEEDKAFEDIYRCHSGMVYRLALRMVSRVEDAEEITQQVFLAVHRSFKSFEGKSSLKTWIYRIAVNCSLNLLRKRKVGFEVPWGEDFDPADTRSDLEEKINAEEGRSKIEALLDVLNEDQRVCILLRAQEGLSYEEIASVLRININTVRSRLNRARMILIEQKKGLL